MPKLVVPPILQYKCACGAISEAKENEFKEDSFVVQMLFAHPPH